MDRSLAIYKQTFLRYIEIVNLYVEATGIGVECEKLSKLKKMREKEEFFILEGSNEEQVALNAIQSLRKEYNLLDVKDINEAIVRNETDRKIFYEEKQELFKKLKNVTMEAFGEDELSPGLHRTFNDLEGMLLLIDPESESRRAFYEKILQGQSTPSPRELEVMYNIEKTKIDHTISMIEV